MDERKILKKISVVLSVPENDIVKTLERFRKDIEEFENKEK
jgi:hypothetical protein